jgi:hypothetical protein
MMPKFVSSAFTAVCLTLVLITVSGCGCGVAGGRCPTTTWTYTPQGSGWVVTATQSYGP